MEQQMERLCAHADVSPEQARAALEACDGDLLDALVWLEQQGIIAAAGVCTYSTKDGVTVEPPSQREPDPEPSKERQNWLLTAWNWLVDNRLEAYQKDSNDRSMECPMAGAAGSVGAGLVGGGAAAGGGLFPGLALSPGGAQSWTQPDGTGRDGKAGRWGRDRGRPGAAEYPS